MSTENMVEFKKANAKFKTELKVSKQQSIKKLTGEINPQTPVCNVWKNIRRFTGLNNNQNIHCLRNGGTNEDIVTDRNDIANSFAGNWSNESKEKNIPISFVQNKTLTNPKVDYIPSNSALTIEDNISLNELNSVVKSLKGKTQGENR